MTPFYITGFPRSRTAWLSSLFNHGPIACLHEPFGRVPVGEWDRVPKVMEEIDFEYVGISDTGLALVYPEIVEDFPGPSIVVTRDPQQVLDSLIGIFGDPETMEQIVVATAKALDKFATDHETVIVPYEALESEDVIRQIWSHLVPDVPWSQWWYEEMSRKKVEVIINRLIPVQSGSSSREVPSDSPPPPPPPPARYRER